MKSWCRYLREWTLDRASVAIPPHLAHCEGRFAASPFPEGGESRESVDIASFVLLSLRQLPQSATPQSDPLTKRSPHSDRTSR